MEARDGYICVWDFASGLAYFTSESLRVSCKSARAMMNEIADGIENYSDSNRDAVHLTLELVPCLNVRAAAATS